MSITLPTPIAAYFVADKNDGDAFARCFTDRAVVKDEGHLHVGRAAITAWKTAASGKYNYASKPDSMVVEGDQTIVTARLVGDFPGSPVDLRYFFTLDGDKIAALEIIP